MRHPVTVREEVAIRNRRGIVGYIVVDYVRNGLSSVNAMMTLLQRHNQP